MYRNIVFDLGGVVVNYNPKEFLVDKFYHLPTETKLYNAVFGSAEWKRLDLGELSWGEAAETFKKRGRDMDMAFEMRTVLEEWSGMLTPRKATVALMRLFKKKGFNLYYLSNISREVLALLSKQEFWPLFDGGVASCETGIAKPDVAVYRRLLERYGLAPQETLFTDDNRENALASFEAGITGIQFKNVKNLCKMLVTYGIDI